MSGPLQRSRQKAPGIVLEVGDGDACTFVARARTMAAPMPIAAPETSAIVAPSEACRTFRRTGACALIGVAVVVMVVDVRGSCFD